MQFISKSGEENKSSPLNIEFHSIVPDLRSSSCKIYFKGKFSNRSEIFITIVKKVQTEAEGANTKRRFDFYLITIRGCLPTYPANVLRPRSFHLVSNTSLETSKTQSETTGKTEHSI